MLSAYHVRKQLRRLIKTLQKRGTFHAGHLDLELETWAFCASAAAWESWWSQFEARCRAQGFAPSAWNTKWVAQFKPVFDKQMPVLDELRTAPRTSGALEGAPQHHQAQRRLSGSRVRQPGPHQPADGPDGAGCEQPARQRLRARRAAAHRRRRARRVRRTDSFHHRPRDVKVAVRPGEARRAHVQRGPAMTTTQLPLAPGQLPHRVSLIRGTRQFVVCDTETTDKVASARILSVCFAELLDDGLPGNSTTHYFNPGVASNPQAAKVNRITAKHLRGQPQFPERLDDITAWLTPQGGRELLFVGHYPAFDADRLYYEYQLAGHELPALRLLDTRRLAEAVDVPGLTGGISLDALCAALGIPRTNAHTATGDVLTTATVAHELLTRIAADPRWTDAQLPGLLDNLSEQYSPRRTRTPRTRLEPDAELDPEHAVAHDVDLTRAAERGPALAVCLDRGCDQLAWRMEDGIVDTRRARWVVSWALDQLHTGTLDRRMTGRILGGLGLALQRSEDAYLAEQVLTEQLLPLLAVWGPCATDRRRTTQRCGRCLYNAGTCRFVEAPRLAVEAFLFEDSGPDRRVREDDANRFLPGFQPGETCRGRPREGLYQRLRRAGMLDAAGHGAALVAAHRRDHGNRDWALRILRKAWKDDCRTPRLAELLASMTVTDATPYERRHRQHIHNAITVLDTALGQDAAILGRYVYRLNRRRGRLAARLASPVRVAAAGTRNTRPPAPSTLGTAPS
jgi:DNA polymerase III epsilon subunit-like protein